MIRKHYVKLEAVKDFQLHLTLWNKLQQKGLKYVYLYNEFQCMDCMWIMS